MECIKEEDQKAAAKKYKRTSGGAQRLKGGLERGLHVRQPYNGTELQGILMDDFNREALCMKGNFSMPGLRIVEYLREAIEVYGKPLAIRVDNDPEFLSRVFVNYCEVEDIEIKYIQPGKPSQNGFVERFNRT